MIDIGVTKLAIIGGIALVIIGPDKLPGLAKTVGTLLGRARRYVAEVKEEVNRSMDLDALKKAGDAVSGAMQDVENTLLPTIEKSWEGTNEVASRDASESGDSEFPVYRHPQKRWRIRIGATPHWYKAATGTRTKVLSGAARVVRFRAMPVKTRRRGRGRKS